MFEVSGNKAAEHALVVLLYATPLSLESPLAIFFASELPKAIFQGPNKHLVRIHPVEKQPPVEEEIEGDFVVFILPFFQSPRFSLPGLHA